MDIRDYLIDFENLKSISDEDIELFGYSIITIGSEYHPYAPMFKEFSQKYNFKEIVPHENVEYAIDLKMMNLKKTLKKYGIKVFPVNEVKKFIKKMKDEKTDWLEYQSEFNVNDISKMEDSLKNFILKFNL